MHIILNIAAIQHLCDFNIPSTLVICITLLWNWSHIQNNWYCCKFQNTPQVQTMYTFIMNSTLIQHSLGINTRGFFGTVGTRVCLVQWYWAEECPTLFPYSTRNAKILIIRYTTNIFLRTFNRHFSGSLLSLISLSESLSNVMVEVYNFRTLRGALDFWYLRQPHNHTLTPRLHITFTFYLTINITQVS